MKLTDLALNVARNEAASTLTIRQVAMLGLMEASPRALDFAEVVGLLRLERTRGSVSRGLLNLEQRGLIRKTKNAKDGRRVWVSLTDEGKRCVAEMNGKAAARAA